MHRSQVRNVKRVCQAVRRSNRLANVAENSSRVRKLNVNVRERNATLIAASSTRSGLLRERVGGKFHTCSFPSHPFGMVFLFNPQCDMQTRIAEYKAHGVSTQVVFT